MDKKMASNVLIVLSLIAAVLAGVDWATTEFALLGLGADSWLGVATVLAVYALYLKNS